MKKQIAVFWLVLLFLITSIVFANDTSIKMHMIKENAKPHFTRRYGSKTLTALDSKLRDYIKTHPDEYKPNRLLKKTAWNFQVGDTHSWWALHMVTSADYQSHSTCRAVGDRCYIFVEDTQWEQGGNGRVTQTAVDYIRNAFDTETPAYSNQGIYKLVKDTFGDPPDVDSDSKIIILILDIQDDYSGTGLYTAGYYWGGNQFPDGDPILQDQRSNEAEIFFIDSDPTDFTDESDIEFAESFLAHEFQHMIHFSRDMEEFKFINEGCSMLAEHICGYPILAQYYFTDEPNINLITWNEEYSDYMRVFRFMLYLYEQFPNDFIKDLVASESHSYSGIDGTLASYSPSTNRRFFDIFEDWCVANYVMDTSVDPRYGYTAPPSTKVAAAQIYVDPNVAYTAGTVVNLGAEYIMFKNCEDLNIQFSSNAKSFKVKAIKIGSTVVEDVPLNTSYTVPDFGTTYSEVTFALINKHQNNPASYTFSAQGTSSSAPIELVYDDGEPEGFLPLNEADTMAVIFEGYQGTYLDHLEIAFRRAGTILMGINQYTGSFNPRPLGTPLMEPMNVVCTTESAPWPYPIPYENWVTVDLSSNQIDTGQDFIVWFPVGPDNTKPGLMISIEPDVDTIRWPSYSSDRERWVAWVPEDPADHIFKYMVHAYLRTYVGIQDEEIEIPQRFELAQNYPNPFNPKTTIHYSLPLSQNVKLKIFDAIGREVAVLVDGHEMPGNHRVEFDGSGLPSGVYLIHLNAGEFQQTQKMILMK